MHILFVHRNFPAQFGHLAEHLIQQGHRCTFVSEQSAGRTGSLERIQYTVRGGATEANHYCSRTFENAIWHTHAVYEALSNRPDIQPDLIVGHSGFGSTLFLRQLYGCPIINYFEYFYRATRSDLDFRPDFPPLEIDRLRVQSRNAMILLDLDSCSAGYCPTKWQRECFPATYHQKLDVIFDGIDTRIWRPQSGLPRQVAGVALPASPIITYVSRGLESMRGFDLFMKAAHRLCQRRSDVHFVIVGADRVAYGGDQRFTGHASFKQWVLSQDRYDLSRFHFMGLIPPSELARLFNLTDLHIYWTVPFVLSWSLLNALACGATVLASNTAPVREVITPGKNGFLVDFFDVDGLADMAHQILNDSAAIHDSLGQAGVDTIHQNYSLDVNLPQLLQFYYRVVQHNSPGNNH